MAVIRPMPARRQAEAEGSELGRQIAVDLEPDADLDEGRSSPGHGRVPLHSRAVLVGRLRQCNARAGGAQRHGPKAQSRLSDERAWSAGIFPALSNSLDGPSPYRGRGVT